MKLKEDIAVNKKQKQTKIKKSEVIGFKEQRENKVKINDIHKVETEAKILSKLKTEKELVVNSEDETGVIV